MTDSASFRRVAPATGLAWTAAAAAVLLLLFPVPFGAAAAKALALAVLSIGLWATGALPGHVTALIFFVLAMLLEVAPAPVVFAGFHSAALWLVFGGLVIGVAVKNTGLGGRVAARLAGAFGSGYAGIIAGMMVVGIVLGFLMPSSMGRVVLLMPVALALAEAYGFRAGTPGRTGLVLAAALGAHLPTFAVLPANVPNVVLMGAAEAVHGVTLVYGEYLLLHFPVLGLLKAALCVGLILWMFPDRPRAVPTPRPQGPMSGGERRLALLLLAALALWVTDALHGISPAWVGLGAAVLLVLPGVGLIGARSFASDIDFAPMFYVAGIMGLGAVVSHSGLGEVLAAAVLDLLPLQAGAPATNFTALSGLAIAIGMLTTVVGTPAVLTPLADEMAAAAGLPLETVLMTQVLGFSTLVLPYQSPPLMVALQIGGERLGPATRLTLALTAATVLVLLPLDYLWWQLLGWI